MTSHDFALWLHGFTELTGGAMPSPAQWKMVVEHLDLVFHKVTPALDKAKESSQPVADKPKVQQPIGVAEALRKAADMEKVKQEKAKQDQVAKERVWVEEFLKKQAQKEPATPAFPGFAPAPYFPQQIGPKYPGDMMPLPYQPVQYPGLNGNLLITC